MDRDVLFSWTMTSLATDTELNDFSIPTGRSCIGTVGFDVGFGVSRMALAANTIPAASFGLVGWIWRSQKRRLTRNPFLLVKQKNNCLLYTSPSPRDLSTSRMPSSA